METVQRVILLKEIYGSQCGDFMRFQCINMLRSSNHFLDKVHKSTQIH